MARSKAVRGPQGQIVNLEFVRSLLERPAREQTRLFWAEGCRNFHCAVRSARPIRQIVLCRSMLHSQETWQALRRLREPCVLEVSPEEFASISTHVEPQGIGLVAEQSWQPLIGLKPTARDIWVVLDNVRTPGNLGTILRTCAAVGANGVMLIGGEADPHDPASIRASMGAIFSQRLVRTSAKALEGWRSRHPCRVIGTSPSARLSYRDISYKGPLLILMGSERSGLRDRQLALCDKVVSLPMCVSVDSLNLAVATGVVLYQALADRSCSDRAVLARTDSAIENCGISRLA